MSQELEVTTEEQQVDGQPSRVLHQSYTGPLPPASQFEHYEKVQTGSAERILTMAEDQAKHRHQLETTVVQAQALRSLLGTIFAFVIVIVGILAGTYLIVLDKQAEGLVAILTPLVTIVGMFFYREHLRSKEPD